MRTSTKATLLIGAIGVLVTTGLPGLLPAKNGPALSADNFDFGLVSPNESYRHVVWLKATGEDTVTVDDIKNCCGVKAQLPADRAIPPGDSLTVVTYWYTRGSLGPQSRSLYVYFRPGNAPLEVLFSGTSVTDLDSAASLDIAPQRIRWKSKAARSDRNSRIRIANNRDRTLAMRLVETSPGLGVEFLDSLAAGAATDVRLLPDESTLGDTFESSLTLELTGNQTPPLRLSIPVRMGDFSFRPEFTTNGE